MSGIRNNPDDVIIDYLEDIRNQLVALNKKLDSVVSPDHSRAQGPYVRIVDLDRAR